MDCCTVASVRQLASVRVLAESYRRQHPGTTVHAVFLDDVWEEIGDAEPFRTLRPRDLGVSQPHYHRMAFLYEEEQLAAAVKPLLARAVLAGGAERLVLLDPETLVLGSLALVREALDAAPLALVPYLDSPPGDDGRTPSSHELLARPSVDLGLLGLSEAAVPFLDWWWDQVAVDRLVARGLAPRADPLLPNRIPVLFEHAVLREPWLTVGYWNAFVRRVELSDGSYRVEGNPLAVFRFDGFDHNLPWLLSSRQGLRPRILVSENAALAALCERYADRLRELDAEVYRATPYRFVQLPGGIPVDERMRALAADLLVGSTTHAGPPDPFALDDATAFVRWLREPAREGRPARYLEAVAGAQDPAQMIARAIAGDWDEEGLPRELVPPPLPVRPRREEPPEADPLAAARAWLEDGALTPWDAGARLGRAGRLYRRALRRLLRPYEFRQRELARVLVEALELEARHAEAHRGYVEILRETLDDLSARELAGRRDEASKLAAARRDASRRLDRLQGRLQPRPYLGDADAFRAVDGSGRPVLGFVGEGEAGESDEEFLATFRGPESRVRDLQRPYLEYLRGRGPVLDLGCGRGELLDLLREAGIEAFGVERSAALVERCRAKRHAVELADGVEYLASQAGGSLGALVAMQVVEHLEHEQLVRLFPLARDRLRPDGVLVLETLNPHSLPVMKMFWVDPSHVRPVFPEVALELCRSAGFAAARIVFPAGTGDAEADLERENEYAVVASCTPEAIGL